MMIPEILRFFPLHVPFLITRVYLKMEIAYYVNCKVLCFTQHSKKQ